MKAKASKVDQNVTITKEPEENLIPDAPTPQSLTANNKFQQDELVEAMALQSNYGRNRGKGRS